MDVMQDNNNTLDQLWCNARACCSGPGPEILRALALKNAKVIFKAFLTFLRIKVLASNNAKPHYCKIFCNSATVQF